MVSRGGGFALVELIFALLLLAVGLVGSAGLMIHSQGLMRHAETREWAARLAASLADSIGSIGVEARGERVEPQGRVVWASWSADGVLQIRIEVTSSVQPDSTTMVFETARSMPAAGGPP